MSDSSAMFRGLWGFLFVTCCDIYLAQHDILWPGTSERHIAKSDLVDVTYLAYLFPEQNIYVRAAHFFPNSA